MGNKICLENIIEQKRNLVLKGEDMDGMFGTQTIIPIKEKDNVQEKAIALPTTAREIKDKIPQISDTELYALCQRIKPVVEQNGELYYIKEVNPRNIAFTWSPEPTKKAKDLYELFRQDTHHNYGYYGFFKPTMDEVIAAIPLDRLDEVIAFQTGVEEVQIDGSVHKTKTIFYGKK